MEGAVTKKMEKFLDVFLPDATEAERKFARMILFTGASIGLEGVIDMAGSKDGLLSQMSEKDKWPAAVNFTCMEIVITLNKLKDFVQEMKDTKRNPSAFSTRNVTPPDEYH